MRNYYGKPIRCPLDCVIRIIQLRAWADFNEALDYEDVRLYLISGKSRTLTKEQMEFASDLRDEIRSATNTPINGYGRRSYRAAGLVISSVDYRRVFYPRSFEERFGGFGSGRKTQFQTPEWSVARERWEREVEPVLEDLRGAIGEAG
ncbi:MAG: hypothetical protein RR336_09265 [Oscillospiraceae bacterium]